MGFPGFIHHFCFLRHVVMLTKIVWLKIIHFKICQGPFGVYLATTLSVFRHLETGEPTLEQKHLTSSFLYFTLLRYNYITFTFALKSQMTSQCVVVVIFVVMMSCERFCYINYCIKSHFTQVKQPNSRMHCKISFLFQAQIFT